MPYGIFLLLETHADFSALLEIRVLLQKHRNELQ